MTKRNELLVECGDACIVRRAVERGERTMFVAGKTNGSASVKRESERVLSSFSVAAAGRTLAQLAHLSLVVGHAVGE